MKFEHEDDLGTCCQWGSSFQQESAFRVRTITAYQTVSLLTLQCNICRDYHSMMPNGKKATAALGNRSQSQK